MFDRRSSFHPSRSGAHGAVEPRSHLSRSLPGQRDDDRVDKDNYLSHTKPQGHAATALSGNQTLRASNGYSEPIDSALHTDQRGQKKAADVEEASCYQDNSGRTSAAMSTFDMVSALEHTTQDICSNADLASFQYAFADSSCHGKKRHMSAKELMTLVVDRMLYFEQLETILSNDLRQLQEQSMPSAEHLNKSQSKPSTLLEQWHDYAAAQNAHHAEIKALQDKYQTLRTWALDMSKKYDAMRANGQTLRDSVNTLRSEVSEVAQSRQVLEQQLKAQNTKFVELRTTLISQGTTDIALIKQQLSHTQNELKEQRLRNLQYAQHIDRLEKSQHAMNKSFTLRQEETLAQVSKFAILLKDFKPSSIDDSFVEICDHLLKITSRQSATEEWQGGIRSSLTSLEKSAEDVSGSVDKIADNQARQEERVPTWAAPLTALPDIRNQAQALRAMLADLTARLHTDQQAHAAREKSHTSDLLQQILEVCGQLGTRQDEVLPELRESVRSICTKVVEMPELLTQSSAATQKLIQHLNSKAEMLANEQGRYTKHAENHLQSLSKIENSLHAIEDSARGIDYSSVKSKSQKPSQLSDITRRSVEQTQFCAVNKSNGQSSQPGFSTFTDAGMSKGQAVERQATNERHRHQVGGPSDQMLPCIHPQDQNEHLKQVNRRQGEQINELGRNDQAQMTLASDETDTSKSRAGTSNKDVIVSKHATESTGTIAFPDSTLR